MFNRRKDENKPKEEKQQMPALDAEQPRIMSTINLCGLNEAEKQTAKDVWGVLYTRYSRPRRNF